MVSACKIHITDHDTVRVWDVPFDELLHKFQNCHHLHDHYHKCFANATERATKSSRTFEVSEMYVFGKFGSFCRRLTQIQEIVEIIKQFSIMKDSHIEGIDSLNNRFGQIVSSMRKKPYNPLDHRKMEFQSDYEEFKRQISDLEDLLCSFMERTFSKVRSTLQSLQLLKRYTAHYIRCTLVHNTVGCE